MGTNTTDSVNSADDGAGRSLCLEPGRFVPELDFISICCDDIWHKIDAVERRLEEASHRTRTCGTIRACRAGWQAAYARIFGR